ncbi:MAG: alpha/beta hydrolase [Paludibacter sp.]
MKHILISFILVLFSNLLKSQEEIKLYPNGPKESNQIKVPESFSNPEYISNISEPRMVIYLAPKVKANGTAVVICPGGGYASVWHVKEGSEIAKWFNELGISAFVLHYRMPNGHTAVPLSDAQTALKIVHKRAKEWNIKQNKIGIMGFSAGGHLASTVGTHFKTNDERPAFMILAYPVVTMDSTLTHWGSRNNLLGKRPYDELVKLYSNELQVTKNTPPTFIVHATDDKTVPVKNSIQLYEALKENKIEAELDTFAVGGHGFGMRKRGIPVDNWPELLRNWLNKQKLIDY